MTDMSDTSVPLEQAPQSRAAAEQHPLDIPAAVQQVLDERTRQLEESVAREAQVATGVEGGTEVLVCLLGGEQVAFQTRYVREVWASRDITFIPCTPEYIAGVVGLRGGIVAVVDPILLLGMTSSDNASVMPMEKRSLVVLASDTMEIAMAVDRVIQVRVLQPAEMEKSLSTLAGRLSEFTLSMTRDPMLVLDAARMLADSRLRIHETVE